jgi:hypothetical protein
VVFRWMSELTHVSIMQVISRLKTVGSATVARVLALDVRRMCAAIRASLETHVRRWVPALYVRRMCAAIRASLETHVRRWVLVSCTKCVQPSELL